MFDYKVNIQIKYEYLSCFFQLVSNGTYRVMHKPRCTWPIQVYPYLKKEKCNIGNTIKMQNLKRCWVM